MVGFEAWENELFDRYNGEGRMTEEDFYDTLDEQFCSNDSEYGDYDMGDDGKAYFDPTLKKQKSYAERFPVA